MKACSVCHAELSLEQFYTKARGAQGVSGRCKACTCQDNRARYVKVYQGVPSFQAAKRRYHKGWYQRNRARSSARIAKTHRKEREACIAAYGGACFCCGECRYEFLALDHTHGGGNVDRKRRGVGGKMARWLYRRGFPPGFRVSCHNCNSAMGYYGYCPHRLSERQVVEAVRQSSARGGTSA